MKFIYSDLLTKEKNIIHTYTTTEIGNLAYHVNDNELHVNFNHKNLAKLLDYKKSTLVYMKQEHKDKIIKITKPIKEIPICDALITNKKNIPLMVMVADCIPIIIYDPIQKVIAVIHAGRAGIFKEILPKTIQKIKKEYNSKEKNILVSLGPSIHKCCYEVGKEIKDEAKKLGYAHAIKETNNKIFLNLLSIIKSQLNNIPTKNIEFSNICTTCNTDKFYSYRKQKQCGRFAGIIMLK